MKIKIAKNEKVCLIGLLMSFNLILLSLYQVNSFPWKINDIGLVSILPVTYFIGLIIFCIFHISLIRYSKSRFFSIGSTLLLIIILFGTPALIEGTPRFSYTFRGGGIIDYISRIGNLNTSYSDMGVLSIYQNWPAIFYLGTFIHIITNISIINILLLTPLISQLFYFIPLYLIFKVSFKDDKKIFFACSLFYVANWVNQDFFAGQNLGFFFVLLTIAIFMKVITDMEKRFEYNLIFLIVFFSVVIAHGLSSIAAFLYTLLFLLILLIFKNIKHDIITTKIKLMIAIFSTWMLYGMTTSMFSEGIIKITQTSIFNAVQHFKQTEELGYAGSETHSFLSTLKIAYALLFLFIGIIGLIYYLYSIKFKVKRANNTTIFWLFVLFSNAVMYITSLYGKEALIRIFLFSIVPLSYFSVQILDNKKLLILLEIFFIISVPTFLLLKYANEQFEYYSPETIKGSDFFYEYSIYGSTIRENTFLDALKNYEKYRHLGTFSNSSTLTYTFVYSNIEDRYSIMFLKNYDLGKQFKNESLIYNNNGFKLFLFDPKLIINGRT